MNDLEIDLRRLGLLLLAAADLSKDRYVLLRWSASEEEWRVNVRLQHHTACQCAAPNGCIKVGEHTSRSKGSPLLALDRAVQWLRTAAAAALEPDVLERRRPFAGLRRLVLPTHHEGGKAWHTKGGKAC